MATGAAAQRHQRWADSLSETGHEVSMGPISTPALSIPWEAKEISWGHRLLLTILAPLRTPRRFAKGFRDPSPGPSAASFLILIVLFETLLGHLFVVIRGWPISWHFMAAVAIRLVKRPIQVLLWCAIVACVVHFTARILGGRAAYRDTFRVLAYAYVIWLPAILLDVLTPIESIAPTVFRVIDNGVALATLLYSFWVCGMSLSTCHTFSQTKAVIALLPVVTLPVLLF